MNDVNDDWSTAIGKVEKGLISNDFHDGYMSPGLVGNPSMRNLLCWICFWDF